MKDIISLLEPKLGGKADRVILLPSCFHTDVVLIRNSNGDSLIAKILRYSFQDVNEAEQLGHSIVEYNDTLKCNGILVAQNISYSIMSRESIALVLVMPYCGPDLASMIRERKLASL